MKVEGRALDEAVADQSYLMTQTLEEELPQNQTLQDVISISEDENDQNLLDKNLCGINSYQQVAQ